MSPSAAISKDLCVFFQEGWVVAESAGRRLRTVMTVGGVVKRLCAAIEGKKMSGVRSEFVMSDAVCVCSLEIARPTRGFDETRFPEFSP